jgi:phage shock protein A
LRTAVATESAARAEEAARAYAAEEKLAEEARRSATEAAAAREGLEARIRELESRLFKAEQEKKSAEVVTSLQEGHLKELRSRYESVSACLHERDASILTMKDNLGLAEVCCGVQLFFY